LSDQPTDDISVEELPEEERNHKRRLDFFNYLFGAAKGFLCIAAKHSDTFKEEFFEFPGQLEAACRQAQQWTLRNYNVYFCTNLLIAPRRLKENVAACTHAWADLDACHPDNLHVRPSAVLQTSPGRFQAFWKFDEPQDVVETELLCKRIAYAHRDEGADVSGWDIAQLLRIPMTRNYKYENAPRGSIALFNLQYRPKDFAEHYPQLDSEYVEFRAIENLPSEDADELFAKYRATLADVVWALRARPPEEDWSQALWQLEVNLAEAGMSPEEMFVVAQEAACNKYARDGRGDEALWKDVQKAYAWVAHEKDILGIRQQKFADLLADHEQFGHQPGFVEEYIKWASARTDAAPVYHEASAFLILSALLSRSIRLPTSFAPNGIVPNLWFLILGDTTLTRKSTSMDMATDILQEIAPEMLTATDATLEGMFTAVAARAGEPAIFARDEFSGMLEGIQRKDYYAGMAEMLTKLYDGRTVKRQLAKSLIEVHNPIFIMFCGGIRQRILELMTHDYIASGFAPRFVFFSAETDLDRYQPLGPPVGTSDHERESLVEAARKLHARYDTTIKINDIPVRSTYKAELTPEAWQRYHKLEREMLKDGVESNAPPLFTPVMQRLSISILKAAVLIAAARDDNPVDDAVIVGESDVTHAIRYGHTWRDTALEVVLNAGATALEARLKEAFKLVLRQPGMSRAVIMRQLHLTAKDADSIFETLEQRALIRSSKKGRGAKYWPTSEGF